MFKSESSPSERPYRMRHQKAFSADILLLTDGNGIPLSAYTTAANHNKVTTIPTLVDQYPYMASHDAFCVINLPMRIGCESIFNLAALNLSACTGRGGQRVDCKIAGRSGAIESIEHSAGCRAVGDSSSDGNFFLNCSTDSFTYLISTPSLNCCEST